MPSRITIPGEYTENASGVLRVTLFDDQVVPVFVPGATLTSMIISLFDECSGTVIDLTNYPFGTDILGVNGGSADSAGLVMLNLPGTAMAIIDQSRSLETHIAQITYTYPTTKTGITELAFDVRNLTKQT